MKIGFKKYGSGEKIVIAFHGFGQDATLFSGWEKYFSEHTIYSLDLFFHGESEWKHDKLSLEPSLWQKIFSDFLQSERIEKFSLLAFSLGGRVAITTLHYFPHRVENVLLLAPDGIKKNFWYLFATRLRTMRLLFRLSIDKPEIFDNFKSLFSKLGSVNKSLVKLAENQMSDRALRKRVYQTWMVYRHFLLRKKHISELFNKHEIPVKIVAARYDRLVPAAALEKFIKHVPHAEFHLLSCGHFKLPDAALEYLQSPK